jgi:hypothetical protein
MPSMASNFQLARRVAPWAARAALAAFRLLIAVSAMRSSILYPHHILTANMLHVLMGGGQVVHGRAKERTAVKTTVTRSLSLMLP